ncbi:MAG TPA: bifunctional DNA-formamidopyrimidine glycosylase/DNA-(apurinic or apyrimidinic site) lyase [Candidatus Acidoferrales bacterium]|nr:bifunctional DNA-formamidopyrimidine glycosylase/DNA-(apurinic or apyrimidinic site) lyase [Candidatus Acidoferrales bacterium]
MLRPYAGLTAFYFFAEAHLPELPEVETVVRGLQLLLRGHGILSVRLGKTDFIDDPATLEQIVPGCRIIEVRRRGKFLVLLLEKDRASQTDSSLASDRFHLIVHLGMTGQLTVRPSAMPSAVHTHVWFALDNDRELRYTDPRRFGRMALVSESASDNILGELGLDALEANEEEFRGLLAGRRARIKALLLDQHVFRGMGNIYTDESLWRARIHPARLGASLKHDEVARLYCAVQNVLREAIRLGGSSISDYVNAEGEPGEFQLRHRVYQREGKKCSRCATQIRRIIVAGRSSYFCPQCQRVPHRRRSKKKPPAKPAARKRVIAKNKSAPRRRG